MTESDAGPGRAGPAGPSLADPAALAARVLESAGPGRPLTLALDYDGTLVPLAPRPPQARADGPLRRLLAELASLPETAVAVVSGRRLDDLRSVLGTPRGVALFAEHGGVGVVPPAPPFRVFCEEGAWLSRTREEAGRVRWPEGTWIEDKTLALALHTRGAGDDRARTARERFRELLEGAGPSVQILEGHEVLEARPAGLDKGLAVRRLRQPPWPSHPLMVYAGDDLTDEDALRALAPGDVGIRVGAGEVATAARFRVADPGAVRELLEGILSGRRQAQPGEVR